MKSKTVLFLLLAGTLEGIAALVWTLAVPSEPGSAWLWGFSKARLLLAVLIFFSTFIAVLMPLEALFNPRRYRHTVALLDGIIIHRDNLFFLQYGLWLAAIFFSGAVLFTWLFIPENLRPLLCWLGLFSLQAALVVTLSYREVYRQRMFNKRYRLLPVLKRLDRNQQRILLAVLLLGLVYMCLFIPVNLKNAENMKAFFKVGGDEYVMYGNLTSMFLPGHTLRETLYHIFIYEDYHYGFPFYFLSALVLLPVRLIFGPDYYTHTQLNLFLLRMLISVLPMMLSGVVLTYLVTRFRIWWASLGFFALVMTLPGVVWYNQAYWHPDSLNVLLILLGFYFLLRDHLRFGRNFYLAAVVVGLSASIRMYGFFFFLSIAGYLIGGLVKKTLTIPNATWKAFLFLVIFLGTFVFSNPFLLHPGGRANYIKIFSEKTAEMGKGYQEADPNGVYKTGWDAWIPQFEWHYGNGWVLGFLLLSLGAGSLWGANRRFHRLLLGWCLVVGIYLVYFVAVKPVQYMLPLMFPFYGAIFGLPGMFGEGPRELKPPQIEVNTARQAALAFALAAGGFQLVLNLMGLFAGGLPL
jgi:hypothetical protein